MIEHNHSALEISYAIADNCPRCRLELHAEELLEAAEKAASSSSDYVARFKLWKIINKIRGK